ncbi:MAG: shikimate dehydrogenase [Lachnospiraceae bacterium]|nr:shikimate dehydrogenase [Lachnospiraceae bacterium]
MEYGLIGEKLGHSYSKEIHEQIGGYAYELKEVAKEDLDAFMKAHAFLGINVTIPYKQSVIPYLDHIDESASKIGAVNTIVNRDGKLYGYNTDYFGLKKLIESRFDLRGKNVLILGNGGTARTAFSVCSDLGAKEILRVSRRAQEGTTSYPEAERKKDTDVLINTTPCGMYPNVDDSPIDLSHYPALSGVIDVIYNPLRTKLLIRAGQLSIPCAGGLPMLVFQAAAAVTLFTGKEVSDETAMKTYKAIRAGRENIVLTGMPGAGKSTVGKMLAKKLHMDFLDTDAQIVQQEGRAITDIFEHDGEAAFRRMEAELADSLKMREHTVIATGGGFILNPVCEEAMKTYGRVVFLDRQPEKIRPTDDRPLANEQEKIQKLYEERLPKYIKSADLIIPVNGTPKEVVNEILESLESRR